MPSASSFSPTAGACIPPSQPPSTSFPLGGSAVSEPALSYIQQGSSFSQSPAFRIVENIPHAASTPPGYAPPLSSVPCIQQRQAIPEPPAQASGIPSFSTTIQPRPAMQYGAAVVQVYFY